jgi:hypothetical protein
VRPQGLCQEDFLTIEDGTDTLSRNVGKELPLDAAVYPRRAQVSHSTPVKHFWGVSPLDLVANASAFQTAVRVPLMVGGRSPGGTQKLRNYF